MLFIKDSLQQQIHLNGKIFGNKWCRCYEGSLYTLFCVGTCSLEHSFYGIVTTMGESLQDYSWFKDF